MLIDSVRPAAGRLRRIALCHGIYPRTTVQRRIYLPYYFRYYCAVAERWDANGISVRHDDMDPLKYSAARDLGSASCTGQRRLPRVHCRPRGERVYSRLHQMPVSVWGELYTLCLKKRPTL